MPVFDSSKFDSAIFDAGASSPSGNGVFDSGVFDSGVFDTGAQSQLPSALSLGEATSTSLKIQSDGDRLSDAIREAYASAPAGVVIIHTLEFRHPNFMDESNNPAPIRAVLGHKYLEARLEQDAPQHPGQYVTFIPMNFDLELPNVEHLAVPEVSISIDNVSRELEDNLSIAAASPYPIEVTYRPFLNTDLTQPQMNPPLTMTLISAEADDYRVSARASYGNAANILCPREVYNETRFPGIQR